MEQAGRKKVEYIELVYDLAFVYLIRRNDALLQVGPNGFFSVEDFFVYLISTLVILQIWAFSTLYINRYGRNSIRDHVCLFINMYLLCYLASGTQPDWTPYYVPYMTAWALILGNFCVQYALQLRVTEVSSPGERRFLYKRIFVFVLQIISLLLVIPIFGPDNWQCIWIPILIGFIGLAFVGKAGTDALLSVEHLTERAMLYIILTFGETIISVAGYFEEGISAEQLYFSGCAFLIVVGMLLSYGYIYNHVMDRDHMKSANKYMMLHLLLVVAINDTTIGLDFMREPHTNSALSTLFMAASFLLFFGGLLALEKIAAKRSMPSVAIPFICISVLMSLMVLPLHANRGVTAALSVVYTYIMFFGFYVYRWKKYQSENGRLL